MSSAQEEEIGVMWWQVKECWKPPGSGVDSPSDLLEETQPCDTLPVIHAVLCVWEGKKLCSFTVGNCLAWFQKL